MKIQAIFMLTLLITSVVCQNGSQDDKSDGEKDWIWYVMAGICVVVIIICGVCCLYIEACAHCCTGIGACCESITGCYV